MSELSPEERKKRYEAKSKQREEEHQALLERLESEGETRLASKIRECGTILPLTCTSCGGRSIGHKRCKKKWCPRCAPAIAASRSACLEPLVEKMRYPLFVTLTMVNTRDLDSKGVRHLRRAFGKLRHRRIWRDRVKGGVASIEVTNIGHGWHPHLHAVVDCRWLAIKTPAPLHRETLEVRKAKYKAAAAEFSEVWAKCLGQQAASVKVKRAEKEGILKEVVKYSVKGTDLIACVEPIGDLIRCLEMTRLMTTFGSFFGKGRRARAAEEALRGEQQSLLGNNEVVPREGKASSGRPGECGCNSPHCVPTQFVEACLQRGSTRVMYDDMKSKWKREAPERNAALKANSR